MGSLEELKEKLKGRILSDKRLQYHSERLLDRLKSQYGYEEFSGVPDALLEAADSSLIHAEWEAGSLLENNTPLLRIGQDTLRGGDLALYIETKQTKKRHARNADYYMNELFGQFKTDMVLDYEEKAIWRENPDLAQLEKEYRNGVLLYEISNRRVWKRALIDNKGLEAYHADNADNYSWGERTNAWIVTCGPQAKLKKIRKNWRKIQNGSLDEELLNAKFCTSDTVQCVRLYHVLAEKGLYPKVDERKNEIGPSPIYTNPSTKGFVIINEVRPPENKTLEEARGQLIADYKIHLEKSWLKALNEKYPAIVNRDLLKEQDH